MAEKLRFHKEAFRTRLCGHLIPDLAGIALDYFWVLTFVRIILSFCVVLLIRVIFKRPGSCTSRTMDVDVLLTWVLLQTLLIHHLRPGLRHHARHQLTPRGLVRQMVGGRAGGVRAGGERVGARRGKGRRSSGAGGAGGEGRFGGAGAAVHGRRGEAGRRRGRRGEWSGWVGHIYRS